MQGLLTRYRLWLFACHGVGPGVPWGWAGTPRRPPQENKPPARAPPGLRAGIN